MSRWRLRATARGLFSRLPTAAHGLRKCLRAAPSFRGWGGLELGLDGRLFLLDRVQEATQETQVLKVDIFDAATLELVQERLDGDAFLREGRNGAGATFGERLGIARGHFLGGLFERLDEGARDDGIDGIPPGDGAGGVPCAGDHVLREASAPPIDDPARDFDDLRIVRLEVDAPAARGHLLVGLTDAEASGSDVAPRGRSDLSQPDARTGDRHALKASV